MKVYTTYQISQMCGVYISTVIDWIEAGKLKAYRTPGGHRRIRYEDLVEFLKKYKIPFPEELKEDEGKKVLVVDDDFDSVELITETLKQTNLGFRIESAFNSKDASKKIDSFRPNLIVLDLKLPDIDGVDFLKQIKENYKNIEVIITTAYPTIKTVVEAMKLGSFDYIVKPFHPSELISVVNLCLERQTVSTESAKLRGLEALYEVSKAMGGLMQLDKLLDLIMKLAIETLEADGGSIMLLDEDRQELVVMASGGDFKDVVMGKRIRVGERIAGKAAEFSQAILIIGDLRDDPRFKGIEKFEENIKSAISVPLMVREKLIGVINIKRTLREEKYKEDDMKLLTVFAQEAAFAIENARLYNELKESLKRLEDLRKG